MELECEWQSTLSAAMPQKGLLSWQPCQARRHQLAAAFCAISLVWCGRMCGCQACVMVYLHDARRLLPAASLGPHSCCPWLHAKMPARGCLVYAQRRRRLQCFEPPCYYWLVVLPCGRCKWCCRQVCSFGKSSMQTYAGALQSCSVQCWC